MLIYRYKTGFGLTIVLKTVHFLKQTSFKLGLKLKPVQLFIDTNPNLVSETYQTTPEAVWQFGLERQHGGNGHAKLKKKTTKVMSTRC